MATPDRDAIDRFVNITGASQSIALLKLQEHGGDLNEALNAHFVGGEGSNTNAASSQYDFVDMENQTRIRSQRSLSPLLSAVRSLNPFSLLNPNYRRNLLSGLNASWFSGQVPSVSNPREAWELPTSFENVNGQSSHLGLRHPGTAFSHGQRLHGNDGEQGYDPSLSNSPHLYSSSMEDDMLQAAIEASKREAEEVHQVRQLASGSDNGFSQMQPHLEDEELTSAVLLSLKTAEEEKAIRHYLQLLGVNDSTDSEDLGKSTARNGRLKQGSSSTGDVGDNKQERAVGGQRSNCGSGDFPQHSEDAFHFEKWGGISSKEYDEAVMLEAALFGNISERTSCLSPCAPHPQSNLHKSAGPSSGLVTCPPSPSLAAQRLLRDQQDNEYSASLIADREKDLKVVKEVLNFHSNEGEASLKALGEEEYEKKLLPTKEASLPHEPPLDDENAVTLLVRMPDGSRHGRRFLKSNKLQSVFDFIDVGKAVTPGTYRVVRPYPKRAFSVDQSASSLNELGLTSKQEVLYLEMI